MRPCFSANDGGTPSACHCARSVPSGLTVVGTETRASRAKSSRNSRPGSPINLYETPDTCAEVIGMRRGASARRPTASKICIALRSEEHTSELQSRLHLVCRLLLEKKKKVLQRITAS